MTANAMEADRRACLDAGMNDHLSKPIDPDRLYAMIARWSAKAVLPKAEAPADVAAVSALDPALAALAPEINAASALKRVLNKTDMYKAMVSRFRDEQCDAVQRLRNASQAGDAAAAEMIAHTLKGLAAQIGANDLSQAAAILKSALRLNGLGTESSQAIKSLDGELAKAVAAIDRAIPIRDAARTDSPAAGADIGLDDAGRALLGRLAVLLGEDDPEAQAFLLQEEDNLRRILTPASRDALSRAIGNFDFDVALGQVRKLLKGVGA